MREYATMLEPAKTVIEICGGTRATAQMAGRHISNVIRWGYAKERRGSGGRIPSDVQPVLLAEARKRGISLRAEHFFLPEETGALVE